jgi:hypothetical protein
MFESLALDAPTVARHLYRVIVLTSGSWERYEYQKEILVIDGEGGGVRKRQGGQDNGPKNQDHTASLGRVLVI